MCACLCTTCDRTGCRTLWLWFSWEPNLPLQKQQALLTKPSHQKGGLQTKGESKDTETVCGRGPVFKTFPGLIISTLFFDLFS